MNHPLPLRWTSIPRDIDPKLASHRAILSISAAAVGVGGLVAWVGGGLSLWQALLRGISVGVATFLSWVIARELDPDQARSALIGLPLAAAIVIAAGAPEWLALFWVIICLRIVNRSTGLAAKPFDSLLLLGLGLAVGWRMSALFVVLAAIALGCDAFIQPGHRVHRALSVFLLLIGLVSIVIWPPAGSALALTGWSGAAFALVIYGGWTVIQPAVESVGDYSGETLAMARLRAAQWLAAAVMLAGLAAIGASAMVSFSSLLAAMLGVAAYGWGRRFTGSARGEA
jgi:hypothetical protein